MPSRRLSLANGHRGSHSCSKRPSGRVVGLMWMTFSHGRARSVFIPRRVQYRSRSQVRCFPGFRGSWIFKYLFLTRGARATSTTRQAGTSRPCIAYGLTPLPLPSGLGLLTHALGACLRRCVPVCGVCAVSGTPDTFHPSWGLCGAHRPCSGCLGARKSPSACRETSDLVS